MLNTVYGKEYLQRIDRFRGKTQCLRKAGIVPVQITLHELADYTMYHKAMH